MSTRRRKHGGNHTRSVYAKKRLSLKKSPPQLRRTQRAPAEHIVVGKLYANWCGHCTALMPEWRKLRLALARKSNPHKTKYTFVEVEQSNMADGLSKLNAMYMANSPAKVAIKGGFPTIFKIRVKNSGIAEGSSSKMNGGGHLEYYEGQRDYLSLFQWYTKSSSQHNNPTLTI